MPRNSSGVYSLPASAGNPVVPGTFIEASWANPTLDDVAAALTGSLPRDGSAPMVGPLFLNQNGVQPLEAVTKQQLDALLGGNNSYLPAGAINYFASSAIPPGWLLADGRPVSRTTYNDLFAVIGTAYGVGNGVTTFNLPDLRGVFIRTLDNGKGIDAGRVMGSVQAPSNAYHTHGLSDPGHTHVISNPPHTHVLNDPKHHHTYNSDQSGQPGLGGNSGNGPTTSQPSTSPELTGITIDSATTNISAGSSSSGVSIAAEGIEARPVNMALMACIRAFGAIMGGGSAVPEPVVVYESAPVQTVAWDLLPLSLDARIGLYEVHTSVDETTTLLISYSMVSNHASFGLVTSLGSGGLAQTYVKVDATGFAMYRAVSYLDTPGNTVQSWPYLIRIVKIL